jgi:hypothetical protein
MKDKIRFDRAIKALVSAFFDETLAKGTCYACAVGNIVAKCIGGKVIKTSNSFTCDIDNTTWENVFITEMFRQRTCPENYEINAEGCKDQIDATGYSWTELAKVEKAFEKNTIIAWKGYTDYTKDEIMQDQYNGLMAVVEVLCEIEGIVNVSEYKEMFAYKV